MRRISFFFSQQKLQKSPNRTFFLSAIDPQDFRYVRVCMCMVTLLTSGTDTALWFHIIYYLFLCL